MLPKRSAAEADGSPSQRSTSAFAPDGAADPSAETRRAGRLGVATVLRPGAQQRLCLQHGVGVHSAVVV